jgi:hypothetical protein
MRFSVGEHIPFPREDVFRFQRDRLADVLDRLPSIAGVEVLSRETDGPRVRTVKRWTGRVDALPEALRAAIPARALQWRDEATWDEERWTVEWAIDLVGFPGALRAGGKNRFEADGADTIVQLSGDVAVVAERVPGGAMVRPLLPAFERFLVGQIRGDLRRTLDAVGERLGEPA